MKKFTTLEPEKKKRLIDKVGKELGLRFDIVEKRHLALLCFAKTILAR